MIHVMMREKHRRLIMQKRSLSVGSLRPNVEQSNTPPKQDEPPKRAVTNVPSKPKLFVKVFQSGSTFPIESQRKQTLLNAALNQGFPLDYKCTKGSCGRCTVKVSEGSNLLNSPTVREREKLKESIQEGYRLACQAVME